MDWKKLISVLMVLSLLLPVGSTVHASQEQGQWEIVDRVYYGPFLFGVDVSADGSTIYLERRDGHVYTVDSVTLQTTAYKYIPGLGGDSLRNLLLTPDETRLIEIDEHGSVYFLDPATLQITDTVYYSRDAGIYTMAVTSDSTLGIGVHQQGVSPAWLYFYDIQNPQEIGRMYLGGIAHLIALTPDETEAYISTGYNPVKVVNIQTKTITTVLSETIDGYIAMDPTRGLGFGTRQNGGLAVIDLATRSVREVWTSFDRIARIIYEPVNDLLIGAGNNGHSIYFISPETGELLQTIPIPDSVTIGWIHGSPDGNRLYVTDTSGYLYVVEWHPENLPQINGAQMNIWNAIDGTGDGSSPDTYYAFEMFVQAQGEFSNFDTTRLTLTAGGTPLNLSHMEIAFDGQVYRINAGGSFGGIPPLGEYAIRLEDANGMQTEPYIIGNLEDYPHDAPDILFPEHEGQLTETQPTFTWEAFASHYLSEAVAPWAYEIDLRFPNGERFMAFPIAGNQTSLLYQNSFWDPTQPPVMEPGQYSITIHSNHQVAPGFNFEHHRSIRFEILPPNQPPLADAGPDRSILEGDSVTLDASGSSDPDGNIVSYEWDLNGDGEFDDAIGITSHVVFPDDGTNTIGLRVTDAYAEVDLDTFVVTVSNVAPVIETITAPAAPVQTGFTVQADAIFVDPGVEDTHTALWDWGDGSSSAGLVSNRTVTGSHVYSYPGVYTITLMVTDDDGGRDSQTFQYVVVYDPDGGFVTGGGWIMSPEGAYVPDPSLSGKATFGFVSKYQKGAKVPTGNTEFQFKVADLNFKSTSYDWLVIAGTKAQYKGNGTINGTGEYKFMLIAIDGSPDLFRIKIWDQETGDLVYDNQLGASDTADPSTTIQGGSIVVHKAK